ncbi:MAG TPA: HIT domain-containing protein [Candidatus Nanoarchaeia archaeon]|nr:HIT domain-containing protein [Candidatus Nanoarchaeia archaeon]
MNALADCEICDRIKTGNLKKLYDDEKVIAFLAPAPATPGHILVAPKEHFAIIEQVPDFIVAKTGVVANKVSIAMFESMNIQGTNLLINNGVPAGQKYAHFTVNIVPRRENDGMNFAWTPRQLTEEEMSTVELNLKEFTKNLGAFEAEEPKPIVLDRKEPSEMEKGAEIPDEENYLLKQLKRLP